MSAVKPRHRELYALERRVIAGGGGDVKGGGGGGSTAEVDPDTLQSKSYARVIDLISEGEIDGWAHPDYPLLDIYLDGTPIQNDDAWAWHNDGNMTVGSKILTTPSNGTAFPVFRNSDGVVKPFKSAIVGRWMLVRNGTNGGGTSILPWAAQVYSVESEHSLTLTTAATASKANATFQLGGTLNFKGFSFEFRNGANNQTYLPGYPGAESAHDVRIRVMRGPTNAWEQTVTDAEGILDAVRVEIQFPALEEQDTETGSVHGSSVRLVLSVNNSQVIDDTVTGKASGPYLRSYLIDLRQFTAPFLLRVERMTADGNEAKRNESWVWDYTEIVYGKFRHPNSALVGLRMDAANFASIPTRGYHVRGIKCKIPANYYPDGSTTYGFSARHYDTINGHPGVTNGTWNGQFKTAWTDNPAWTWYDMASSGRYGLGNLLMAANVDIFALYVIGQYSDAYNARPGGTTDDYTATGKHGVNDGKTPQGWEPRFTCNLFIQRHEDAIKVLQDMAGIFRGMIAYRNGMVVPIQDAPSDPSAYKLLTPANVIGGVFNYSGVGLRARHNVCVVSYSDLSDAGRLKQEYVEDHEAIVKTGAINQLDLTGFGCASRSQARRIGLWSIYAEKLLTDTVTCEQALEGFFLQPGGLVQVQDPFRAGETLSGRLTINNTTTTLHLDREITLFQDTSYTVAIIKPTDNKLESRAVTTIGGPRPNGTKFSTINCSPFSFTPEDGSVFQLAANDLLPQPFRLLGATQKDDNTVELTGLEYNESLYDFVDFNHPLDEPPVSRLPPAGGVMPPEHLRWAVIVVIKPDLTIQQDLELGWDAPPGERWLRGYRPTFRYEHGNWQGRDGRFDTAVNFFRLENALPGNYEVAIYSVNTIGVLSPPLEDDVVVPEPPTDITGVTGLELFGGGHGTRFQTRDAHFVWRVTSGAGGGGGLEGFAFYGDEERLPPEVLDPMAAGFEVVIWNGDVELYRGTTTESQFIYTWQMNRDRAEAVYGEGTLPFRVFTIEVCVLFLDNSRSASERLRVENPPPGAPIMPTKNPTDQGVTFQWINPDDPDLDHVDLFASTDPDIENPPQVAEFRGTSGIYFPPTTDDYTYWLAEVDSFGTRSALVQASIEGAGGLLHPVVLDPVPGKYYDNGGVGNFYVNIRHPWGREWYQIVAPGTYPTAWAVANPVVGWARGAGSKDLYVQSQDKNNPAVQAIVYGAYQLGSYADTPQFSPLAGEFHYDSENLVVTITSATAGATIHYSTDGGATWNTKSNGGTVTLPLGTTELHAYATYTGRTQSSTNIGTFRVLPSLLKPCYAPTFNPNGGAFTYPKTVVLDCGYPSDAQIVYTTDGTIPSLTNGTAVANHSTITLNAPCTLKAIAVKLHREPSPMTEARFLLNVGLVLPVFTPSAGVFSVFPMDVRIYEPPVSPNVRVHYTMDGTIPSETHGDLLSGSGNPGKSPDQVAGLKLWLKADSLSLSDGQQVATWADSSGNGFNVSSWLGSAIYKTNVLNGKPVVRFNAAALKTAGSIGVTQPDTIIIVAKQTSKSTPGRFLDSSSGSARQILGLETLGQFDSYAGGTSLRDAVDHSGLFHVFSIVFNGASTVGYVDSAQVVAGNPGSNGLGGVYVGSDGGVAYLNGDIAEIVVIQGATADRAAVEQFLGLKYALPGYSGGGGYNDGVVSVPAPGTVLKAIAYGTDLVASQVASGEYKARVNAPTHEPDSCFYTPGGSLDVVLDVASLPPGETTKIRYTTNGTIPSRTVGTEINPGDTVTISGGYRLLQSIAYTVDANSGYADSLVKSSTYDWSR